MLFVHENVKVELFPGTPSPIVHLSENDVGDTLAFELIYKGQPVNVPNGSVVKFKGTKKDGLGFTVDSSNVSGNVVSFVVSEDMTSCSGVVESEISIILSNNKHGTCNVVLIVEKNPHSDGTQDGSYPQIVSEMRELVEQIEGDAETASNAATVAVGAKNVVLEIQQDVHQYTADAIDDWLDAHPEVTTTVQDGAITETKLYDALKLKVIKDYVTPEMFGAVGDGVTDDSQAIQNAINSGKVVKFSKKIYLVSSPITIEQYSTIKGDFAGWNNGGAVIKASDDFVGEYVFIIRHINDSNYDVCRSINVENININCNKVSGGILAIHLYDASMFKNLNISQVGSDKYGINLEHHGKIAQTVTFINVVVGADTISQRDGTKALINFERLQECTFINVRSFTNNSESFKVAGCQNLLLINCTTYDYTKNGKAFNVCCYAKEGYVPLYTGNITMIGCLNEGNSEGLYINTLYQTLAGNFSIYDVGTIITQGSVTGVIGANGTSDKINVYTINGTFAVGSCSNGEITTVTNVNCEGIRVINYQPKINGRNSAITVIGAEESIIEVNKSIGTGTAVDYTLNNNKRTKIIVGDDVGTITTDYSTTIDNSAPLVLSTNGNGQYISNVPSRFYEGMEIIILSDGNEYDCKITFPEDTTFGTRILSLSFFKQCKIKFSHGKFNIIDFDGLCIDRNNQIILIQPKEEVTTLNAVSIQNNAFETSKHYINAGMLKRATINMNTLFVNKLIKVTSVNSYEINVVLQNNATTQDGSTSVTVQEGETKTFQVLTTGIVSVW